MFIGFAEGEIGGTDKQKEAAQAGRGRGEGRVGSRTSGRARMEICKDEEVLECIRKGTKFQLDPSVTELSLNGVAVVIRIVFVFIFSSLYILGLVF